MADGARTRICIAKMQKIVCRIKQSAGIDIKSRVAACAVTLLDDDIVWGSGGYFTRILEERPEGSSLM